MSSSGAADVPPAAAAARRGRPRNAAVDRAVIDTVVRLIAEGTTFSDLTVEGIAREAGVGKATVYRRWTGKDALLLDVLAEVDGPPQLKSSGVLRDDLIAAVEYIRQRSLAKRESALLRTMVAQAQSNPELWRRYHDTVVAGRRRMLIDLLERGVASGEIAPGAGGDLDLLADMVVGPVLVRATLRPDAPLEPDLAERVVDTLLGGLRPRP
ncbi:transcriptional regulator, TetR family [Streptomyces sp. DvalAA-14]|uniref:TetR/AcrR family transcriptional regulator n=1 Tax=unclassified Streptomyces TaxID=2593676 RepID=UPI00081B4A98|nr:MULTISPECIES: TetR/AcrR family transcriptional regulator [unclassified Streptomyces]MYS25330.1 TetR family transcriptional regulator [Streptomyces sp. SID4948]SCE53776.1 transcriptional regulator, TetR family [Streptomyces sp. DvalAA-14]